MGVVMEAEPPVDEAVADTAIEPIPALIDLVFEEAFEDLYARAYRVGYQLLGRRSEAEDVAQETLARAYVRWRRIQTYAEAWVVRVSGNLAIDTWRRDRKLRNTPTPDGASPGPTGARVDLHRALARLSRRQRDVVVLRFLADLPEADVARVLGCSVGTVKQHAARGLTALRTSMGEEAW